MNQKMVMERVIITLASVAWQEMTMRNHQKTW
jgi:hypothetical protein